METKRLISRRTVVKSSLFGLLAVSLPGQVLSASAMQALEGSSEAPPQPDRYPAIDEKIVAEVVGVSHFNLDRLKELVDPRPELARATWDWGFGDWETAIGAGSHVGRRDIVDYLMSKGARPDIFAFAMLGAYETVRSMIEFSPGVQKIQGPHGISLLQHVKNGLRAESGNKAEAEKLQSWLESLGDADGETYPEVAEEDKQKYLGDYKYGDGPTDGFTVSLNMRKMMSLGKIGRFGGALLKTGDNRFLYNGVASVSITFLVAGGNVESLTVQEPGLTLTAKKL